MSAEMQEFLGVPKSAPQKDRLALYHNNVQAASCVFEDVPQQVEVKIEERQSNGSGVWAFVVKVAHVRTGEVIYQEPACA